MQNGTRPIWLIILVTLALGTLAGLFAGYKRLSVEGHNRGIEVGLEFDEVTRLAQIAQTPLDTVLARFKEQHVSSIIVNEDLLGAFEQSGQAHATHIAPGTPTASFVPYTFVNLDSPATLTRVREALTLRGIATVDVTSDTAPNGITVFDAAESLRITSEADRAARAPDGKLSTLVNTLNGRIVSAQAFAVGWDYQNLRTLGLGLSPESVQKVKDAQLSIVGRIGNFPGVTPQGARNVLMKLKDAGVHLVIFNGDETLGYRGLEKSVGAMFRDPKNPAPLPKAILSSETSSGTSSSASSETSSDKSEDKSDEKDAPIDPALLEPTGLVFGEVEFTKQKGDEMLAGLLHGDFVRVHAIQSAEMAQLDERDVVDRFVRAARERNIRFCYVRLMTTANRGSTQDQKNKKDKKEKKEKRESALDNNVEYIAKITHGIARGTAPMGGGYGFKLATRFGEPGPPILMKALYLLLGLGTAAGTLWMVREFCPLPARAQTLWLGLLMLLCGGLALLGGETGRKLVALLAGIVFPTVACLKTYPTLANPTLLGTPTTRPSVTASLTKALSAIAYASAITAIGIVHVIGLLASRPFMVRADQYLGIKAQHAVPLLIMVFLALIDGVPPPGETWKKFKARVRTRLQMAYQEPARFGTLIVGILAIALLLVIVARTGNDSAVGASGFELKMRNLMDRVLLVRPRTKEFLGGHPAFVLAIAWWWRGRKHLAIPAFLIGSIGQVSLLNTFCHIHTPLIISAWRDVIGLALGCLLGAVIFVALEGILPTPARTEQKSSADRGSDEESSR